MTTSSFRWSLALNVVVRGVRMIAAGVAVVVTARAATVPLPSGEPGPFVLWTGAPVPNVSELPPPVGIDVRDIRPADPAHPLPKGWIKGVHLAWHKARLYASFGYNRYIEVQGENTKGEECLYLTSDDKGQTWSQVLAIASGEGEMGISHGVFLSHRGSLWSFNGAFHGSIKTGTVHTRAFTLNESAGRWEPRGVVVDQGFWPLQEPLKMADGNWIMAGARVGDGNPAAVAISRGDDLTKWDLVVIPKAPKTMWGESSVILEGRRVINLARSSSGNPVTLVAVSEDFGRTWTPSRASNLPMAASRPYANLLSTGQRYLVANIAADIGNKRAPLTIAVSRSGEAGFRTLFKITEGKGAYPAAVEHDGVLYVGWTASGPRLARTPIASLAVAGDTPSVEFWAGRSVPKSAEIPVLQGVEFHVIKKHEPTVDGYPWLHGVGLAWHHGKLYASFGHNQGAENTATEEARGRVSTDGGRTWGDVFTIDTGTEAPDLAVSSGVFHSHRGTLWAFHGAFYGKMGRIHTRAYTLDESNGRWVPKGVIAEGGFWALNQPVRMADGNWIMPGTCAGAYSQKTVNPPAVAISHGDDFTRWDLVRIPTAPGLTMWGESAVIVDGARVVNIARWGEKGQALVALSSDYGRTWTPSAPSNLPMATSKPCAGVLRTGQRYLVCTTTADSGKRRSPLTIAVSRPGENVLRKVFVIRPAVFPEGPGESHPSAALAYPYAIEHEGKLYVGYSNGGGRSGNHNSAELAIIPISTLRVD
jgi:hypothetical protein